MPIIEFSTKLSLTQEERRICSNQYVFFRVIDDQHGARIMTATAPEDAGQYRAFENQKLLISTAVQVFGDLGLEIVTKEDHAGRQYVETRVSMDENHLVHVATTVLNRMGFDDVSVLALQEMLELHNDYAIDDGGEDAFFGDGMWVTSDGRFIEK